MDPFSYLCFVLCLSLSYRLVCSVYPCGHLWERVDLLALLAVVVPCVFVTYLYDDLGQVWYMIVSIPDLCLLLLNYLILVDKDKRTILRLKIA